MSYTVSVYISCLSLLFILLFILLNIIIYVPFDCFNGNGNMDGYNLYSQNNDWFDLAQLVQGLMDEWENNFAWNFHLEIWRQ